MLAEMNRDERLLLLRFVCSFAWVDGDVAEAERAFVKRLMQRMDLAAEDQNEVHSWLLAPPDPPDPAAIPAHHRRAFLEAMRAMMFVDGRIDPEEEAHFDRLRGLLD
jgi:uncharacterized tellurite resistance protein B-like protein